MALIEDCVHRVSAEAVESGERRLIALAGGLRIEDIAEAIKAYARERGRPVTVLYSNVSSGEEVVGARALAESLSDAASLTPIDFDESELALGGTWDVLLADFSAQMRPDDIGRLVETVRGGGLVVFTLPPLEAWLSSLTLFQRKLASPPYSERDVRNLFKLRFLKSIRESEGAWLIDLEAESVHGKPRRARAHQPPKARAEGPVRSLALTDEQVEVIDAVEEAREAKGRYAVVVIANRGRGKSAALGLGLSLIMKKFKAIGVTAPSLHGVQTLFEFLERGLRAQGLSPAPIVRDGERVGVRVGRRVAVYLSPPSLADSDIKVKVVDEAASIPTYLLFRILRSSRVAIFSSTIHGYEGAGRGFSQKFLSTLAEEKSTRLRIVEMRTPIRYPPGDPIEKWLYKLLLLDAEPGEPDGFSDPEYIKVDFTQAGEGLLKKWYGIYVLAHYRNRPNDLAIILDAPHHSARALASGSEPLVSIQLAEEGRLEDDVIEGIIARERDVPGHMIPSRILMYYGLRGFARLWGWRIVRIATHPALQRRGLGSRALREVCREAMERGMDWVGSGFGASEELLRFWIRNGFTPIHLSPTRNQVSGEYSVFVAKPLTERAEAMVRQLNLEMKKRVLQSLHDIYFSMPPEIARLILATGGVPARPKLTYSQKLRLLGYIRGYNSYEMTCDALAELARAYFLGWHSKRPLTEGEERLLIAKVLQGKNWDLAKPAIGLKKQSELFDAMRSIARKLAAYYKVSEP